MKAEVKPFKLNVPADLMEMLKDIARRESRSISAQMNLMLRKQVGAAAGNGFGDMNPAAGNENAAFERGAV